MWKIAEAVDFVVSDICYSLRIRHVRYWKHVYKWKEKKKKKILFSRFSPHALSTLSLAWVLTWVTLLGVAFGFGRPVLGLVLSATWCIKCNKLMLHVVRSTWCQSPHLLHRLVGEHLQAACNLLAPLSNLSCSRHRSAVPFYLRFSLLNSLSALFSLGKSVFYHNDEKL